MSNYKHGCRNTKLYRILSQMKTRCYNSNYEHFKYYGGKGVTIHKDWLDDFVNFKEWSLNNGYQDGLEIDRIDRDGNYCPQNCKWSTRVQQVRNRSNTLMFTIDNETKPFAEWCDIHNINYKLAHARYKKGFGIEEIFSKKVKRKYERY